MMMRQLRHPGRRLPASVGASLATLVLFMGATQASPARAAVQFESWSTEPASLLAGAHADLVSSWVYRESTPESGVLVDKDNVQEIIVKLPPGTLGNVNNFLKCPRRLFTQEVNKTQHKSEELVGCPAASEVGEAALHFSYTVPEGNGTGDHKILTETVPIYSVEPGPGEPALLGIQGIVVEALNAVVPLAVPIRLIVRAEDNYAVTTKSEDITLASGGVLLGAKITLWAIPGAHARIPGFGNGESLQPEPASARKPFMENPTSCSEPLVSRQLVDTYQEPEVFTEAVFPESLALTKYLTGCESVPFAPSVDVGPRPAEHPGEDTTQAGTLTGVTVNLMVPQNNDPLGQRTSEVEKVVATLPQGMTLSPSAASNGLHACSDAQLAYLSSSPAECPASSEVGTAEVISPLLTGPLIGQVFIGQPLSTDQSSGKMFRLFLQLQGFGVVVKVEGSVTLDPQSGQITGTFANLPQQPFSEFKLHFKGGPNAPLVNPPSCGSHTAVIQMTPYSAPESWASPSSSFETSFDGNGTPCPATLPFSASGSISSSDPRAGALAPFSVSFSRPDGDQAVRQITATLPPGLLGYISKIQLCDAADAAAGACPAESRIGVVSGIGGPGPDPVTIPGNVYLAEGSNGYPFELSVVVPAVAGPFNIGNVVVLAYIEVNNDGSITAVSGPVPSILDGVPVDIRGFMLTVDRPGFAVNPTNCGVLSASAALTSLAGATAEVSSPFQVSGCGGLGFKPSFTVAVQGSTSRLEGESLTARYSQKPGEANLHSVRVELPKQLPSRLTTLQKACAEAVFAVNPAACGRQSIVGTVKAWTPLLARPLVGPAYFVSHGGAKFPELIFVLQGDGVTIEVAGETFISKTGVTSSTFPTVPDVPVSGFQLKLPEGPYSALAATGRPCREKLVMPTTITGQNGVVVKQKTRIAVTGCPKAKNAKASRRKARQARHARRARNADRRHDGPRGGKR
jgi:hypothetical protein